MEDRKRALQAEDDAKKADIQRVTARLKDRQQQLEDLSTRQTETDAKLSGARDELAMITRQIADATNSLAQTTAESNIQTAALIGIRGQITHLQTQIAPIQEQIKTLRAEQADQENKTDAAKARTITAAAYYQTTSERISRNITTLEGRASQLALDLAAAEPELEAQRSELNGQRHQLEERDKNLRIREFKVARGEQKIIRNADLLGM